MFPRPVHGMYTIYTKRDCVFCDKVKDLLKNKPVFLVECDEIDRELFLDFIDKLTPYCNRTFPYVFKDDVFIGGFAETDRYERELREDNKSLSFYDDDF